MSDIPMTHLAGGGSVPDICVAALDGFEARWPGASFHGARAGIAHTVINTYLALLPSDLRTQVTDYIKENS